MQHRRLAAERHRERHHDILVAEAAIVAQLHRRTRCAQPLRQRDGVARLHLRVGAARHQQHRRQSGAGIVDWLRRGTVNYAGEGVDRSFRIEREEVVRAAQPHHRLDRIGRQPDVAQPPRIDRQHHRIIGAGRMARDRDPPRIAAIFRDVIMHPAQRVGAVLDEGRESHARDLAIIGHHHDEPRPGEGACGEGIGGAVAIHPAAAIDEDHDGPPARCPGGAPHVERLPVRSERHAVRDSLDSAATAHHAIGYTQPSRPGHGRVEDADDQPDQPDPDQPAHRPSSGVRALSGDRYSAT